jgi:argininosuccinate lyase
MHAFNQSLKYDQRMHDADIRGSIAYAKGLTKIGILTPEEETKMIEGLKIVGKEWADGVVSQLLEAFTDFTILNQDAVCSSGR